MKWLKYFPEHWQLRVKDYLASKGSSFSELSATDFTNNLKLTFEDGSNAFFIYAFYLVDEPMKEVAVFTEHCGYHVFPFGIETLETVARDGSVLNSERFIID